MGWVSHGEIIIFFVLYLAILKYLVHDKVLDEIVDLKPTVYYFVHSEELKLLEKDEPILKEQRAASRVFEWNSPRNDYEAPELHHILEKRPIGGEMASGPFVLVIFPQILQESQECVIAISIIMPLLHLFMFEGCICYGFRLKQEAFSKPN